MKCEMRWLPISAMRARPECCGLSPIAEDLDDAMRDLIYNVAGRTLKLPVALDADRHDRVEMKLDLVFPRQICSRVASMNRVRSRFAGTPYTCIDLLAFDHNEIQIRAA